MSATAPTLDMARSRAAEDSHYGVGPLSQSRLVRQEVALGLVRQLVPNDQLIGLTDFAPVKPIEADDFVIQLGDVGPSTKMAPARADDAEAELFQQDRFIPGEYRGRTIDWAIKSLYTTSDVNTHRDLVDAAERMRGGQLPLTIQNIREGFDRKVARDRVKRREMLDYRLNWLIMQSVVEGAVAYNDGKVKFNVNWGRPADQHREAPASGTYAARTHDPIGDVKAVKRIMRDRYGIEIDRAYCSQRFLESFWNSDLFLQIAAPGSTGVTPQMMPYLLNGWGPDSAVEIVERATGVRFIPYDAVYRTRPEGSTTFTSVRWTPVDDVIFMPNPGDIAAIDETDLGFGRTLTSPHPAGNWTAGFYDWEQDLGQDPWGYAVGTGIKAFPVFPHMNWTYTWQVTLPA